MAGKGGLNADFKIVKKILLCAIEMLHKDFLFVNISVAQFEQFIYESKIISKENLSKM